MAFLCKDERRGGKEEDTLGKLCYSGQAQQDEAL